MSHIRVYMDGSGIEGQIGAAAVLYWDGVLKRKRRLRLGSTKHHTVYEGEGIGIILVLVLIGKEEEMDGMVMIGSKNTAAISTMQTIKLSPSHHIRLLASLRKTLPRSKSAARQEFNQKLKLKAAELWKDSVRFERMERIDLNYKASNFTKLMHNLHQD